MRDFGNGLLKAARFLYPRGSLVRPSSCACARAAPHAPTADLSGTRTSAPYRGLNVRSYCPGQSGAVRPRHVADMSGFVRSREPNPITPFSDVAGSQEGLRATLESLLFCWL